MASKPPEGSLAREVYDTLHALHPIIEKGLVSELLPALRGCIEGRWPTRIAALEAENASLRQQFAEIAATPGLQESERGLPGSVADLVAELRARLAATQPEFAWYFSYDPEMGFELHGSYEEAKAAAEDHLHEYRIVAGDDGWDESVTSICFGAVLGEVFEIERIPWVDYMRSRGASEEELAEPPPFDGYVDYSLRVRAVAAPQGAEDPAPGVTELAETLDQIADCISAEEHSDLLREMASKVRALRPVATPEELVVIREAVELLRLDNCAPSDETALALELLAARLGGQEGE